MVFGLDFGFLFSRNKWGRGEGGGVNQTNSPEVTGSNHVHEILYANLKYRKGGNEKFSCIYNILFLPKKGLKKGEKNVN